MRWHERLLRELQEVPSGQGRSSDSETKKSERHGDQSIREYAMERCFSPALKHDQVLYSYILEWKRQAGEEPSATPRPYSVEMHSRQLEPPPSNAISFYWLLP